MDTIGHPVERYASATSPPATAASASTATVAPIATGNISPLVYQRLVLDFLRDNKWTVLAFVLVILLTLPVEAVVLPRFYSRLFEGIRSGATATRQSLPALLDVSSWWSSGSVSGVLCTIAGIWLLVWIGYILKNTISSVLMPSYMSFIRQRLFAGTVEKHSSNYKDIRVGEEVTRIMDVSRNMRDVLGWLLEDLCPVYLTTLVLVVYLFGVSPWIGGVTLCGVVVHSVVFGSMMRHNINLSATREHYYLQMSEKLHDSFGNLMNIYLNNMKDNAIRSNNRAEAVHTELMRKQYRYTRNMVSVLTLLSVLTFLITIGITYSEVRVGRMTATSFVAVWIILLLYLTYMIRLSETTPNYITKLGIMQCSNDFLSSILQASDKQVTRHTIDHGKIVFQDVSFTYPGSETPTLYQFSLTVQPREKVAILGTSGSGKTTALKLLTGMHHANDGLVQIDDVNVSDYNPQYLRKQVNYINQRTQLFNTSILKNIQYGNRTPAKTIGDLLTTYELDTVYSKLKDGIYTNAGVNGGSMSLGMQKITMLLRGLLRSGKVILLDEPLAGLDAKTRKKVLALVRDRCYDRTLVVITHDKEVIPMMDRVVNLGEVNHTERHAAPHSVGPPPPHSTA